MYKHKNISNHTLMLNDKNGNKHQLLPKEEIELDKDNSNRYLEVTVLDKKTKKKNTKKLMR